VARMDHNERETGVIVVDHGSVRKQSNDRLLLVARLFEQQSSYTIVEPAHMELAEPSIATAMDRCVERGAKFVIVSPYFLLPGKHWSQDIPNLASAAAKRHPGVSCIVTAPLGLHSLIIEVMQSRIDHCLLHAQGQAPSCDVCKDSSGCRLITAGEESV